MEHHKSAGGWGGGVGGNIAIMPMFSYYQLFPYEKNPLVNVTRSRVVVFQEEMVDPIIYGKKRKQTNTMTYH